MRWHQFASWTPLLRQHGRCGAQVTKEGGHEYYLFGGNTTAFIKAAHMLRYRMLPYTYGLARLMHTEGGTIQRAMVLQHPQDKLARRAADQYYFGLSFLIAPVLEYGATSRQVYFPAFSLGDASEDSEPEAGNDGFYYDFWSGAHVPSAAAPVVQ